MLETLILNLELIADSGLLLFTGAAGNYPIGANHV
jgi:hypothetical protein